MLLNVGVDVVAYALHAVESETTEFSIWMHIADGGEAKERQQK
jgi:hypothetical protein